MKHSRHTGVRHSTYQHKAAPDSVSKNDAARHTVLQHVAVNGSLGQHVAAHRQRVDDSGDIHIAVSSNAAGRNALQPGAEHLSLPQHGAACYSTAQPIAYILQQEAADRPSRAFRMAVSSAVCAPLIIVHRSTAANQATRHARTQRDAKHHAATGLQRGIVQHAEATTAYCSAS